MQLIKKIRGLQGVWSRGLQLSQAIVLAVFSGGSVAAESCLAPQRPFVPSDPQTAREFADIIGRDFELYIRDIQSYFRCLEEERMRAFEEAREVSQEYGRFLEMKGE